jgi:Tfp pilus assembly protein PilO
VDPTEKRGVAEMMRKIGLVLCLLLFAGAVLVGQQSVWAKDQQQSGQKQNSQKQSFKEKYDKKVNQFKKKIQKKIERRTPTAVTSVRG